MLFFALGNIGDDPQVIAVEASAAAVHEGPAFDGPTLARAPWSVAARHGDADSTPNSRRS